MSTYITNRTKIKEQSFPHLQCTQTRSLGSETFVSSFFMGKHPLQKINYMQETCSPLSIWSGWNLLAGILMSTSKAKMSFFSGLWQDFCESTRVRKGLMQKRSYAVRAFSWELNELLSNNQYLIKLGDIIWNKSFYSLKKTHTSTYTSPLLSMKSLFKGWSLKIENDLQTLF